MIAAVGEHLSISSTVARRVRRSGQRLRHHGHRHGHLRGPRLRLLRQARLLQLRLLHPRLLLHVPGPPHTHKPPPCSILPLRPLSKPTTPSFHKIESSSLPQPFHTSSVARSLNPSPLSWRTAFKGLYGCLRSAPAPLNLWPLAHCSMDRAITYPDNLSITLQCLHTRLTLHVSIQPNLYFLINLCSVSSGFTHISNIVWSFNLLLYLFGGFSPASPHLHPPSHLTSPSEPPKYFQICTGDAWASDIVRYAHSGTHTLMIHTQSCTFRTHTIDNHPRGHKQLLHHLSIPADAGTVRA
jgi:hypothetical protein